MHFYTEHCPFGRQMTLIIDDQNEVMDEITGPEHAERADRIAADWNEHEELFRDFGGESG